MTMDRRAVALITWGGSGLIAGAGVFALALNIYFGESVFAARLLAGLAGCL